MRPNTFISPKGYFRNFINSEGFIRHTCSLLRLFVSASATVQLTFLSLSLSLSDFTVFSVSPIETNKILVFREKRCNFRHLCRFPDFIYEVFLTFPCFSISFSIGCDMMRYQRVSPDYIQVTNGRKTHVLTCKEDVAEGGELNYNGFHENDPNFRSGSNPSTSNDPNSSQFLASDSLELDNHAPKTQDNKHDSSLGGDVLLQWGHKKRSRGPRAENRVVTDESLIQERQMIKVHKIAIVSGLAKQGTNLRAYPTNIETTPGSVLNRNLVESSSVNVSLLSNGNGNGQIHSFSLEKRSPPSPEKTDKAKGSIVQASAMNVESAPKVEAETAKAAEKMNLDKLEWPRIYISLSRKEKEDDFLIMKGTKLPQRPKKRSKNIDRTLQYCFPGMWLSDLTRSRYEVREKKCVKKKRRGLKGLEKCKDSDSE
ncbi:espin isoform X1 [Cinnamomum micranthum f. kanehirae]|uniref:Espin isoform X1 n=1 Tax=Cinnamomum micranthum f. kanehirae TaxID=337451 RepID=A0A3S3N6C3_9MAGN|nr:espin isoform X1 [Cinnamomum micranthum f. kanehirae]